MSDKYAPNLILRLIGKLVGNQTMSECSDGNVSSEAGIKIDTRSNREENVIIS